MSNTGGPAFPTLDRQYSGLTLKDKGMTLRDYFAAKAMHALLVQPDKISKIAKENKTKSSELIAEFSYQMADAMLAERTKGKK